MTGLLLINLGTPDAPTEEAVRTYLREFLMDPDVIDIAWPFRWFLVNVILRKRPAESAALYRKIWSERGSPLLAFHNDLVAAVAKRLPAWAVAGGMRYGKPSLETGMREVLEKGATELVIFPLYPQLSQAATGSSVAAVNRLLARLAPSMPVRFVHEFFGEPLFIRAFADRTKRALEGFAYDHLLFSFHGLPARQVLKQSRKVRADAPCFGTETCCDRLTDANRACYRAQCFETALKIAAELGLAKDRYTVCFQSRLDEGWIRPFTDEAYRELPKRGVKKIAVVCPAFVADCLETLEEVAIRGREEFVAHGGEELRLVPSLNSDALWVEAVAWLVDCKPMPPISP